MKFTLRDKILIAMFAALIAIGAFIQIPSPIVPFTLQYLFVAFAGVILGSKKGLYSVLLYILIGLIGIPIFSKGGGITYIFQPTFGYIIGFAVCAFIIGFIIEKSQKISILNISLAIFAGLFCVYLVGVSYMYMIVNLYFGSKMTFLTAIATGFTPFIVTDLIQSIIIAIVATQIIPILSRAKLIER